MAFISASFSPQAAFCLSRPRRSVILSHSLGRIEGVLGRLALGQRLGDLERQLALVLVGPGDDRVRHHQREALLDRVQVLGRADPTIRPSWMLKDESTTSA
jgi:hypothetical protein